MAIGRNTGWAKREADHGDGEAGGRAFKEVDGHGIPVNARVGCIWLEIGAAGCRLTGNMYMGS